MEEINFVVPNSKIKSFVPLHFSKMCRLFRYEAFLMRVCCVFLLCVCHLRNNDLCFIVRSFITFSLRFLIARLHETERDSYMTFNIVVSFCLMQSRDQKSYRDSYKLSQNEITIRLYDSQ